MVVPSGLVAGAPAMAAVGATLSTATATDPDFVAVPTVVPRWNRVTATSLPFATGMRVGSTIVPARRRLPSASTADRPPAATGSGASTTGPTITPGGSPA